MLDQKNDIASECDTGIGKVSKLSEIKIPDSDLIKGVEEIRSCFYDKNIVDKKDDFIANQEFDKNIVKEIESLEQCKDRIDSMWEKWQEIKDNKELINLFDRRKPWSSEKDIDEILQEHNYPQRTKISNLELKNWKLELNSKFIKDGFIYLLRGDHPKLDQKGIYSRTYGYSKLNTKQIVKKLNNSNEAGYFLSGNDIYLKNKPYSEFKAEELAYLQSAKGGSSFISTTTSIPCAKAGTGNMPDKMEQSKYEIYVLKIPVDSVINSNTNNYFGMEEDEYLIPDFVGKKEIVAKFQHNETEEVYKYLNGILGISKKDLRLD